MNNIILSVLILGIVLLIFGLNAISAIFGALFIISIHKYTTSKTGNGLNEDDYDGIITLNEGYYVAKLNGRDIFAIAEKLNSENRIFWLEVGTKWTERDYDGGNMSFVYSIEDFNKNIGNVNAGETWVVYFTETNPLRNIQTNADKMVDEIIVAVTVKTGRDSLVTSHMGVQKGPNYRVIQDINIRKKFEQLSVPLHAFASKVMLKLNPNRKYQVNTPILSMLNIFLKSLPLNIHYGDFTNRNIILGKIYSAETNVSDLAELEEAGFGDYVETIRRKIPSLGVKVIEDSFKNAKNELEKNKKLSDYPGAIISYRSDPFKLHINNAFDSDRIEDSWIKYHDSLHPNGENFWVAIDIIPLANSVSLDKSFKKFD